MIDTPARRLLGRAPSGGVAEVNAERGVAEPFDAGQDDVERRAPVFGGEIERLCRPVPRGRERRRGGRAEQIRDRMGEHLRARGPEEAERGAIRHAS